MGQQFGALGAHRPATLLEAYRSQVVLNHGPALRPWVTRIDLQGAAAGYRGGVKMRGRILTPRAYPERLVGPAHVGQRRRPERGIGLPVHLLVGLLVWSASPATKTGCTC